ncbi:hypothetical protein [Actinoplanes sp. NBRC 103695]|nr:hypothetical protein [Actinoplanes sp. NBRC 103695]
MTEQPPSVYALAGHAVRLLLLVMAGAFAGQRQGLRSQFERRGTALSLAG